VEEEGKRAKHKAREIPGIETEEDSGCKKNKHTTVLYLEMPLLDQCARGKAWVASQEQQTILLFAICPFLFHLAGCPVLMAECQVAKMGTF
jgi:hypothetical protein